MSLRDFKFMSNDELYAQFKVEVNSFRGGLDQGRCSVITQPTSLVTLKQKLAGLLKELYSRQPALSMVCQKQVDERFWSLIKHELKKAEKEGLDTNQLDRFLSVLDKNKAILVELLKTAWQGFQPLDEPHVPEAAARKLCARILVSIAEIVKLEAKQNKDLLPKVRDLLDRSHRLYAYASRTQELLGMCNQQMGDLFGSIYWISRSMACIEPVTNKAFLVHLHDELNIAWCNYSVNLPKALAKPKWYVSCCLTFLKLQGIFFVGAQGEESKQLFDGFLDSLQFFLCHESNGLLLQYMAHLWIFSIHYSVSEDAAKQPDPTLFRQTLSTTTLTALQYCSLFIAKVLRHIQSLNSVWLPVVLLFNYWIELYPELKNLLVTEELLDSIAEFRQILGSHKEVTSGWLSEEYISIGFLPIHRYFVENKNWSVGLAQDQGQLKEGLSWKFVEKFAELIKAPARLSVVIDGRNVAMRHGNGYFSATGIKLAVDYFTDKGIKCSAVVPQKCLLAEYAHSFAMKGLSPRKNPVDTELLRSLDEQTQLLKVPASVPISEFCIEYARSQDSVLITNDRYWDYVKQHPEIKEWLKTHECPFTFHEDKFIPSSEFDFARV